MKVALVLEGDYLTVGFALDAIASNKLGAKWTIVAGQRYVVIDDLGLGIRGELTVTDEHAPPLDDTTEVDSLPAEKTSRDVGKPFKDEKTEGAFWEHDNPDAGSDPAAAEPPTPGELAEDADPPIVSRDLTHETTMPEIDEDDEKHSPESVFSGSHMDRDPGPAGDEPPPRAEPEDEDPPAAN